MDLQYIRNLIGEGETANAVKALLGLLQEGAGKNKRLRDDLLIMSSQLQELKRKDTMGVLDTDEVRHQYAQLNSALLILIEELEMVNPDASNVVQRQETPRPEPVTPSRQNRRWWWLLLPLLAVGGGIGVFKDQIFHGKSDASAPIPPKVAPDAAAVLPPPLARFTFENAMCKVPCEVRFKNESRYADAYRWDFGDGVKSSDAQPKHIYRSVGNYTITLVAIKDLKLDTSFQRIQIVGAAKSASPLPPPPKAGFLFAGTPCKAPCDILFTNTSTHATRYQWTVDGASAGASRNLGHRFEQPGQYEIRLVAISANGRDSYAATVQINPPEEDLLVGFAIDKKECEAPCQIQCSNRSAHADRYEWRVNGRLTSRDKDFAQTFPIPGTYIIQLTGYRGNEAKNTEHSVSIVKPVVTGDLNVGFVADKAKCIAPCQIQFSNRSTNADRYEWRVNGRLTSRAKDFIQTFSTAGTYVIQLTGYRGNEAKNTETSILVDLPGKSELIVAFTPTKTECEAPCQVQFINRSTNTDRYEWRVNGRLTSRDKDFAQTFSALGNYVIQLTGYQGSVAKNVERTIRITTPLPKQSSSAPTPLSPASGTVFSNFPRATTLRWRPVSQAQSYSVELDCMGCCASGRWCTDVGKTYQIKEGLSVTTYNFNWVGAQKGRWRVWAKMANGKVTDKSAWQEFNYTR